MIINGINDGEEERIAEIKVNRAKKDNVPIQVTKLYIMCKNRYLILQTVSDL